MKNSKRILSATIKHMLDDSPDTSWLGEYSTKANSDYSIYRRHTEDCATAVPVNKDAARMIGNARGTVADIQALEPNSDTDEWQALEDAYNQLSELEGAINYPECDCGGTYIERNSCEYFNPNWSNYKGLPEEEIRKYCRQDFDRMESLNNQNWYFIGIEAIADIQLTGSLTQEITSGGLWGIESDSDKAHIKEVEDDQLVELRSQLKALGFSSRAISTAFKNVERKEERRAVSVKLVGVTLKTTEDIMKAYAIDRIPEKIFKREHSALVSEYLTRKYSKYGFKKDKSIEYNPEFVPEGQKRSLNPDKYRWVQNVSNGLRFVGDAHDIIRLDHTGYFTDNFHDETVHGQVFQLTARNGKPQYVPAVNDPCNDDCACVDFSSITDDKEDAARWADSMADSWAEQSREYQAAEDAKNRIEEIATEIKQIYADYRQTIRDIKADRRVINVPVVRRLIRAEWRDIKQQIHELRKESERIEQNGIEYPY